MLVRILVFIFAIVSFSSAHAQDAAVERLLPQFNGLSRAEALRVIRHAESYILYDMQEPILRGRIKDVKELEELEKRLPGVFNRAAFSYRALALATEKLGFSNLASLYRSRSGVYSDRHQGKISFSEFTKREAESESSTVRELARETALLEKDSTPTRSARDSLSRLGGVLGKTIVQAAIAEFPSPPGQDKQATTRLTGYGRISRSDDLALFFLLGPFQTAEECGQATKTFADDVLSSTKATGRTAKVEISACDARVPPGSEYEALQKGRPVDHYVLFTHGLTAMFAHRSARLEDERVACEKMLTTVQATKPTANCYRPSPAMARSTTVQPAPPPAPAQRPALAPQAAIAESAAKLNGLSRSEILRAIRGAEDEVSKDLEPTIADARFLSDNEKDVAAYYKRAGFCYRALTSLLEKNNVSNIAAIYRARAQLYDDILQGKTSTPQFETREKENDSVKLREIAAELATLDKKAPPKEATLRSLERLGSVLGQVILAAVHSEQGDVPYVHSFNQGMIALKREDYATVAQLLRPLAERGDRRAQFWIGHMYEEGKGGLPRDFGEALKWFQRSADRGEQFAQYRLGSTYASGTGVARDLTAAYVWFSLAASQGDEDAAKARNKIEPHMTPEQVTLAKKRASDWKRVTR